MMADAVLERIEYSDHGAFGRIWARGLGLFTGEQPWRDNARNVSCIPPAPDAEPELHRVVWTFSPRFRRFMYLLLGTEPRTGIRKHPANLMGDRALGFRSQLNGCIALGERLGWLDGQKALLLSAPAVRRFEAHMGHAPFVLEIRNHG
jgi:hypothetical protein